MLRIDNFGMIENLRIKQKRFLGIEKNNIAKLGGVVQINGIVVHQTHTSTAQETFNSYKDGKAGAHLLIDKDGTIYQTASIYKVAHHVGQMRSRCIAQHSCDPTETQKYNRMKWQDQVRYGKIEKRKIFPYRYPSNDDSIGIEIVSKALPNNDSCINKLIFESVTSEQNNSLKWMVAELTVTLNISMEEIYRHSDVA
ncbi:MAG: peptidoglycan recognition family protein, partial [Smithella sp.]